VKYLGPLSSAYSGTRLFYVDLSNQLDSSESLSTIDTLVCSDSDVILAGETILSSDLTTKDGHVLSANKSIKFRAGCAVPKETVANITIEYTTDQGNSDSTITYLKIVPSII